MKVDGTEREAAAKLVDVLNMEVEGSSEKEEGEVGGEILALGSTGFLIQEADPGGTTLVDAHNKFNELSCL